MNGRNRQRDVIFAAAMTAALVGLLGTCGSAFGQIAFAPPPMAQIQTLGDQKYFSGEVYLASHADTAQLVPLGFVRFEFQGRSVRTVKYAVLWPMDADLSDLPPSVSGLVYDEFVITEWPPDLIADMSDDMTEDESDVTRRSAPRDYRERSRGEQNSRAIAEYRIVGDYFVLPDGRWIPIRSVWGDLTVGTRKDERKRESGEFDRDDLARKGTFITSPSGKYPFRKVTDVGWKDPDLTGNFRVMPVEKGVFHKPQNVGRRDSKTCGNFQITPHSTLKDCGIGSTNWYRKPSGTGSFGFGPSNYQPRDGYFGVGYRSFPVSYPSQYRPSIRTPDSRGRR
ncbi:hypothetical protein KKH27_00480 [bacterium]|nr:hypothetical protein [bacterium]MBU1984343.1 hypothetical protein [bacterium]